MGQIDLVCTTIKIEVGIESKKIKFVNQADVLLMRDFNIMFQKYIRCLLLHLQTNIANLVEIRPIFVKYRYLAKIGQF